MPELPEVQTTVDGLNKTVRGRRITAVRTTYDSPFYKKREEIKNPAFFKTFQKKVVGQEIIKAERRAKNILIHLSGGDTIIVHMKMTGHFVYDRADYPHVRLAFTLDNGKILSFSDLRKFAKVALAPTAGVHDSIHLKGLGPEPLEDSFNYPAFKARLMMRPKGKVKQVLMDPYVVAGIGNIYSDEILWRSCVHPLSVVEKIPEKNMKDMFKATKELLKEGIDFGGDSTSDYKNIEGEAGKFQARHQAYRRTKKPCGKRGCPGTITRLVIGTRSAHFCPVHQVLYGKK
ncbi:DNA-formamidopyrimidine glycosylase [Candidatus Parcubacteria bacterium]|nr:DNA-formamidopyrimidine glycosylase [Candidatus Parcubacteria bacterium]